jgi:Asp-tRNA(Asn)/Glu-tRNA(Gln) amidotransferase A subunit family amidase
MRVPPLSHILAHRRDRGHPCPAGALAGCPAAEHIELLLTPTNQDTAPPHRPVTGDDFVFTLPASLTGSPAVTVPAGRDRSGLPIGVQLGGGRGRTVGRSRRHLLEAAAG